jgi:hypothetical protein
MRGADDMTERIDLERELVLDPRICGIALVIIGSPLALEGKIDA